MEIDPKSGVLGPQASASLLVTIHTAGMEPGRYSSLIRFTSNDTTVPYIDTPCRLEVRSPDHDLAIKDTKPSDNSLHLLFPNAVETRLVNYGLNDETDLDVACLLSDGQRTVYADTVHVPALAAGTSRPLHFDPIFLTEPQKYDFSINILNPSQNDYNLLNNRYRASLTATNLLDDFESESDHWIFEGGWGVTDAFAGHSGGQTAHPNNGKAYEPGMDAKATLKTGFDGARGMLPVIRFWSKYATLKGKDWLYFETSTDSIHWVRRDSLTGSSKAEWVQREINLNGCVQSPDDRAYMRFHFVSNPTKKYAGFVMIDDVEIYEGELNGLTDKNPSYGKLITWSLSQNYPNPFNSSTMIRFTIPSRSHVVLKVYDLLGREAATLKDETLPAGEHTARFDAANLTSGVYFVRISAGEFRSIRKLLVIR